MNLPVMWLVTGSSVCVFISKHAPLHTLRYTDPRVMLQKHPQRLCAVICFLQPGDQFALGNAWSLISSPYWPGVNMCATAGWVKDKAMTLEREKLVGPRGGKPLI